MRHIKVAKPSVGEEEAEAVRDVLLSGNYVSGDRVREFEAEYAQYIGVRYCVAVNSGTSALHLALVVLGVQEGDEVIVPPLTFFSTISAVLYQRAKPVFCDIDEDSYCISPQDMRDKITDKTKAVIPVHLWGGSCDMDAVMEAAVEHDVKVVEDAAQAQGTEYGGRKAGSIGDIGCFSFFATKHMTTGEGGALVTDDDGWDKQARILRSHGMTDRDHHIILGYNYRMNEIAAAIGLVQLKKLDELNEKRIENSLYLLDKIRDIPWLTVPKVGGHVKHTYFWCPILVNEEELGVTTKQLRERLMEEGVETRHRYWEPLYRQKVLTDLDPEYGRLKLPNAERIAGKVLGLPNHPGLSRGDLDYVAEILTKIG